MAKDTARTLWFIFSTTDNKLYAVEYAKWRLIISSLFGPWLRIFYTQQLYVFHKKCIISICIQNV